MSEVTVAGGLGELFPNVTSDEAARGLTTHRCVYLVNSDRLALLDARLWVLEPPAEAGNELALAVARTVGDVPTADKVAGPDLVFASPVSKAAGLDCPRTLGPGEHVAVWIRRRIAPGARSEAVVQSDVAVEGDMIPRGT